MSYRKEERNGNVGLGLLLFFYQVTDYYDS